MTATPTNAERLRSYLLGLADEDETEAVERGYFAKEESLEAVAEAEEGLIDDYLSERLPAGTTSRFESAYLRSPLHRHRVAIARALRDRTTAAAAPNERFGLPGSRAQRRSAPWMPLSAAAAVLIAAVVAVWSLQGRLGGERPSQAITLPALLLRGEADTPTARIDRSTGAIELRLERGATDTEPPFEVAIRTVEGTEVWRGPASSVVASTAVSPRNTPLRNAPSPGNMSSPETLEPGNEASPPLIATVNVPAERLAPGDYVVVLMRGGGGGEELHSYYFRAVRP